MVLELPEIPEMFRSPEAIGLLRFCEEIHTSVVFLPVLAHLPEQDLSRCSLYWKKINTEIKEAVKVQRSSDSSSLLKAAGQAAR